MQNSAPFYGIVRVGENFWSINGSKLLHKNSLDHEPTWREADGDTFAIGEVPAGQIYDLIEILEDEGQHDPDPEPEVFQKAYYAGGRVQVYALGTEAFIKIKKFFPQCTQESVTLRAVQERGFSFKTPEIIFDWVYQEYTYLVTRRIDGRTLEKAWPDLDAVQRDHYLRHLVGFYQEMAEWKGEEICGVDGKQLSESFLSPDNKPDWSHERLLQTCEEIALIFSDIVFQHTDMGPGNVIVAHTFSSTDIPAVLDWEAAGFAPRGWILTKILVSIHHGTAEQRAMMEKLMKEAGFFAEASNYFLWRHERR